MSHAHDWDRLRESARAPYMTLESYLELPEDLSRTIEVTNDMIVHCESPTESHIGIRQNLVAALQSAINNHDKRAGTCHRVRMDIDMLLKDTPTFTFRRPDVLVYRCLPDSRSGKWRKPRADDAEIVIEVVSAHSKDADLLEKRARYAAAGIPCYWIVRMAQDDGPALSVEKLRLTVDGFYVSEGVALRAKSVWAVDASDPVEVTISWEDLDGGL